MLVEVAAVKAGNLGVSDAVAVSAVDIATPFLAHEVVGVLLQVPPHFGMVGQVLVEDWMSGKELRVVRQSRIGAQLMGDVGMLVEITVVELSDRTGVCRGAEGSREDYCRECCNALFHDASPLVYERALPPLFASRVLQSACSNGST